MIKHMRLLIGVLLLALMISLMGCLTTDKGLADTSTDHGLDDEQTVAEVKEGLSLAFTPGEAADNMCTSINLPPNINGVAITWAMDKRALNLVGSTVTAQRDLEDILVNLIATLTKGRTTATKTFAVTVKALTNLNFDMTWKDEENKTAGNKFYFDVNSKTLVVENYDKDTQEGGSKFTYIVDTTAKTLTLTRTREFDKQANRWYTKDEKVKNMSDDMQVDWATKIYGYEITSDGTKIDIRYIFDAAKDWHEQDASWSGVAGEAPVWFLKQYMGKWAFCIGHEEFIGVLNKDKTIFIVDGNGSAKWNIVFNSTAKTLTLTNGGTSYTLNFWGWPL